MKKRRLSYSKILIIKKIQKNLIKIKNKYKYNKIFNKKLSNSSNSNKFSKKMLINNKFNSDRLEL